jgi:hypothetical protein
MTYSTMCMFLCNAVKPWVLQQWDMGACKIAPHSSALHFLSKSIKIKLSPQTDSSWISHSRIFCLFCSSWSNPVGKRARVRRRKNRIKSFMVIFLHHFLKAAPIWCKNLHSIPNILALPINIGHTSCNSTFQPLKQQRNTFTTRQAMLKMVLTSDPWHFRRGSVSLLWNWMNV